MSSIVQLKRSALSGKVPGTGSLNLGELALNTYDGKIFFRRSGSTDTIQEVVTTNVVNTGSVTLTGTLTAESIRTNLTASFGSLKVNDTLTVNHGETIISGSALVTSDLTILGAVNARQFNISVISSSVLFESGSSRFGNTSDDTHSFTGSVQISGSQNINGNIYLTGSIIPSGSSIFDLGTETNPFRHLYASSGSIYMDGTRVIGAETRPVKIGDTHEGGIVFYIDSNSHCLIIDSEETGRAQSQYLQIATGATGTAIGTGQSNTNLIMARSASVANDFNFQMPGNASHQLGGAYYGLDGEDPAYVCHNLIKGGFSDWFLPSVDEMKQVGVAIPSLIYQGFDSSRYHWTSTYGGNGYTYYTVDGSGRTSRPSSDSSNQQPFRAIRRSTNLTIIGGLTLLTNTTYSGSITTLDGLVNGINISSSFGLSNERLTELESSSVNLNIVSASLNTYTASASGRLNNIEAATASYETNGRGIISGSSQLSGTTITNLTITNLTTVNETASVIFSSGSNRFGDFGDDIHSFTGSLQISGSQTITGSVTATSFVGNGSGLTDLVVDLGTAQLNDVDGNNIPARSFAELYLACAVAEIVDLDFGI
jgi:cytoskeletal protein CcmA (bactofilin family)